MGFDHVFVTMPRSPKLRWILDQLERRGIPSMSAVEPKTGDMQILIRWPDRDIAAEILRERFIVKGVILLVGPLDINHVFFKDRTSGPPPYDPVPGAAKYPSVMVKSKGQGFTQEKVAEAASRIQEQVSTASAKTAPKWIERARAFMEEVDQDVIEQEVRAALRRHLEEEAKDIANNEVMKMVQDAVNAHARAAVVQHFTHNTDAVGRSVKEAAAEYLKKYELRRMAGGEDL